MKQKGTISELVPIETKYRRIISAIPHPGSVELIEQLKQIEPRSMSDFSPLVWDRAEGFQVWDGYGNKWIDFSSSVVLANAGHSHPLIAQAIRDQLDKNLWHNYLNPSAIRLRTVQAIAEITPPYLDKVFLLTTGAEAIEAAIKLSRIHGQQIAEGKFHILSYHGAFHGRTMATQAAGGFPEQQQWMGAGPPGFHHVPFPDSSDYPEQRQDDIAYWQQYLDESLQPLREAGIADEMFAGVISETFQGSTVAFMPRGYAQALRQWASEHQVLLVFDEIQAGFGRTGKWFGFQHYGVAPDLVCLGKSITSSLPMSAVVGRAEILDLPGHGEMSSTHTGNPLCAAAAIANIEAIRDEGMVENAAELEAVARERLVGLRDRFPARVGTINGKGLVWGVHLIDPDSSELDIALADAVTIRCMEMGLIMLRTMRGTLKIAPPLCITEAALCEGLEVIEQALGDCV